MMMTDDTKVLLVNPKLYLVLEYVSPQSILRVLCTKKLSIVIE